MPNIGRELTFGQPRISRKMKIGPLPHLFRDSRQLGAGASSVLVRRFRVRRRRLPIQVFAAFLVAHVGQHRPPQFAFFQTNAQFCQVGWEGFHVVIVVARVFLQILTRQLTRSPSLVEGMTQQVILGDARIQLLEEFFRGHTGSSSENEALL
jgi:hypothetical protein